MRARRLIWLLRPLGFAVIILTAASCERHGFGVLTPAAGTWVATEPIQCLGNPWEQDWLSRHGNDARSYPRDRTSQETIIVDYYARLGIEVRRIVSIMTSPVTCDACTCPRGDTLFLLVPDRDAATMVALGYRPEAPPPFG